MTENRVKLSNIVENQVPSYVREEFPLVTEFISQYYVSQEFVGSPSDLIQNIDKYVKVDETANLPASIKLGADISFTDDVITVDLVNSPTGTNGFPDKYGLLQIDNEIITYTGKTFSQFTGCIRGFSGIKSLKKQNSPDELVFESTSISEHTSGSEINNLSSIFLREFLTKTKYQILPGMEDRDLAQGLNQASFIKNARSYYNSKGTEEGFKILFKALYGEEVDIITPKIQLLRPSDANYQITKSIVVDVLSGDPLSLVNSTLYQDQYQTINRAYAPIGKVETLFAKDGRIYYKLGLDGGYNRDISSSGATYGDFVSHPRTKIIGNYTVGDDTIDVDSTIGFPESGELRVEYDNPFFPVGVIEYTSKSNNQFFGVSGINGDILDATNVDINTYAYAYGFDEDNPEVEQERVEVRITSVIENVSVRSVDNILHGKNDTAIIKSLGYTPLKSDFRSNNWLFNNSPVFNIIDISLIDSSDKTYEIVLSNKHFFRIGDDLSIISNSGNIISSRAISISGDRSLYVRCLQDLSLTGIYTVKRNLLKVTSQRYTHLQKTQANVQNVYNHRDEILVSTGSLPYYDNQQLDPSDKSVIFSGTFSGNSFAITTNTDHGFYTGDAVYYTPEKTTVTVDYDEVSVVESQILSFMFVEGLYYVRRINSTIIQLARSKTDLYNQVYVTLDNTTTVNNNKFEFFNFRSKTLQRQDILRQITIPQDNNTISKTLPGCTGILVNGVEILNYKSNDSITYGTLEEIEVTATGSNYDVINPPLLNISDSIGVGATAVCSVVGSLQEIRVLDSGFGYVSTPDVVIRGGNGSGAVAYPNLSQIQHSERFDSSSISGLVGLGSESSTIGFSTYHKFLTGERVFYRTNGQTGISGLSTDAQYFVSVRTPQIITLHTNTQDSIAGINTVLLSGYGIGSHNIEAANRKFVVSSISISDSGDGYENKERTCQISGINTAFNYVTIKNHGYSSGEIVKYTSSDTSIGGLTNNSEYFVTRLDSNRFKLSQVGVGTAILKSYYYDTRQYIDLTTTGIGSHTFNYPEISVEINGLIGISSIPNEFKARLQPIFRGEISSVHIKDPGVGYGSSEVLNFDRQPLFRLINGQDAQLTPIISNGSIVEVIVNNGGSNYNSPPEIQIIGDGRSAILNPILENGVITSVRIISGGFDYFSGSTFLNVIPSGSGAEFRAKIKEWKINLLAKNYNFISRDDGFLKESINEGGELQYSHIYAPRKLREVLYASDQAGKILYGRQDLIKNNNIEVSSTDHSPIIGWAYDGNPIYGPYGYSTKTGGIVTQMKSGYQLVTKDNRPPSSLYPLGFFIEDYEYREKDDDSVLDERNGRFCVTPEFPKGTYAYFATISQEADSSGKFSGYKSPVFPYLIGDTYKSAPNEFNFRSISNQSDFDLTNTLWLRNILPFNLLDSNDLEYPYADIPNKLEQVSKVTYASFGNISSVGIITGGNNYSVGDFVVFDNTGTEGFDSVATVSEVSGKSVSNISVASTSLDNLEAIPSPTISGSYLLYNDSPHNLIPRDIVTIEGSNVISSDISGVYEIQFPTNILKLRIGVGTPSSTGIVTHFTVFGDLSYPKIRENDFYSIGTEQLKILNVDSQNSRIRVLRSANGTSGYAHTATETLYELPRKVIINPGFSTTYNYRINTEIYFNPAESVGLGTLSGVGIGSTLRIATPSGITSVFIPTRSIYLPNNNLETGDLVVYQSNGGDSVSISTDGISSSALSNGSTLYVAKINNNLIGLSTVRVGLGTLGVFSGITSETSGDGILYFTGLGTGSYHSIETQYQKLTTSLRKNKATVSTSQTHGLITNNIVNINVSPQVEFSHTIKYSDYGRKMLVNPKSFTTSEISINNNTITLQDHNLVKGQKVLFNSEDSIGLENNSEYYVIFVDKDTIKLASSYYNSTLTNPLEVGITSTSNGVVSPINPPITLYKNSTVTFDLSDSTLSYVRQSIRYSAFRLDFYKDGDFKDIFEKTEDNNAFEIEKYGRVGISSDARVVIRINDNFPQRLYYTLTPVYESDLPIEKEEILSDIDVLSNNLITIRDSVYSGSHRISGVTSTTFDYTLRSTPESVSYGSSTSSITYTTGSLSAFGPIKTIEVNSSGKNYYSLPGITTVLSNFGSGCILEAKTQNIGNPQGIGVNDIGFDFPTDTTLNPYGSLPTIVKIEALSVLQSVGVSSFGRGYTQAPKLLVFDGKTNELLPEADLRYTLGNGSVEILNNVNGINNTTPRILPIQNTNGVGISSIYYDSGTKIVSVVLSVGFSTDGSFPFAVGDKVLVENVSVGLNSTGKGFNSKDYDYNLFTVSSVDENIGGIGTVRYSLEGLLSGSEFPGTYDNSTSFGRIIPEKAFPIFNVSLIKKDFVNGESVRSITPDFEFNGIVQNWDNKTNYLRISTRDEIQSNILLEGLTSKSIGITSSSKYSEVIFNKNYFSRVKEGFQSDVGFLNTNLQRLQDSDYYQNFSYSLKSKIPYQTWSDAMATLNHTMGYKKFSDLQVESKLSIESQNSMVVGVSTSLTGVEIQSDLEGFASLNCVYDFDLVKETSLRVGSSVISDEIIFTNRVLSDYFESVGNRVLKIDDISPQFNSNPRPSKFSEVNRFPLSEGRSQKYIIYVRDKRYINQRQLMLVNLLHDGSFGYLNQYARVESNYDMGSFDFSIEGSEGLLLFYPTRFSVNDFDVTSLVYNLIDTLESFGGRNIGSSVDIDVNLVQVQPSTTTNVFSIPDTYRSVKVLSEVVSEGNEFEFDELNIIHDGNEVSILELNQLTTHSVDQYSSSGFGTYNPYLLGGQLKIDFIPHSGVGTVTVNTFKIQFADESSSGIGTVDLKHSRLEGRSTSIASTTSPTPVIISDYIDNYDGAYAVVQISDITNNRHQLSEVCLVDDADNNVFYVEYGNIKTYDGEDLGSITATRSPNTQILFTPLENIDVEVKVFLNALRYEDDLRDVVSIDNTTIQTKFGSYFGTERDVKKSFEITHDNYQVFQREFLGNSPEIVSVSENTIQIPNHFFVTGEEVVYSHAGAGTTQAISIAATSFSGIGVTGKIPSNVFIIKVDENKVKLARSAEDALTQVPKALDITNVGIGTSHTLKSTSTNSRVIVTLDNIIQSPVVSTALTTTLSESLTTVEDVMYFSGITSFFGGDLVKIGDEIMKIESVGVGSTNAIRVQRPWLGTNVVGHSTGSLVTKVNGSYNIVGNTLNFTEAPYGNIPFSSTTNPPNERDWLGISTSSSFHGRIFLRSGTPNSQNSTYSKNYIFDEISTQFDGSTRSFNLTSNGVNATGFSTENAVILINDVFQGPGLSYDYTLSESVGITSIRFTGTATSFRSDVNTSNLPVGGVIISVGSYEGFGYQPLVSAGGTAVVSVAGTISAISIGNSGSGYRVGIQTVRVGVGTSSLGTPNIHFVGTATITDGHVTGVAITNPGTGYTSSNPPYVVFDYPLSYSDIPLQYSGGNTGVGTEATVDIVVGQGSSVINFEIKNNGYGYGQSDILTVPVGGLTGIPTTSGYDPFLLTVQKTFSDKFTAWNFGELQVLDRLDDLFDGERLVFPLSLSNQVVTIRSTRGSNVNVEDTLMVFVNDILQVPGRAYQFEGGSSLTFTEAPKEGDTSKIIFYRGSGNLDVIRRNILETVKVGDDVTISYDPSVGQTRFLQENERTVSEVVSTDVIKTSPYFGPGNVEDPTLRRPAIWCRQTTDRVINEREIGKDRILYEPIIQPFAYIIQPVSIGQTIVYVDNIRPFFNPQNENDVTLEFQKKVKITQQDVKVSAAATAVVDEFGTIDSITLTDGGLGYDASPVVTIQSPVGLGTTQRATAVANISSTTGIVTSISVVGVGTGYDQSNPPVVLIEPPRMFEEDGEVDLFSGDSGVIVGFGLTTTVGLENQLILDLYIPQDSYLRNTSISGSATTISSLSTGDYFMTFNTNVGSADTAIYSGSLSGGFVAIGTQFIDNIYQVASSEIVSANVIGVGTTSIRRVFSNIIGISSLRFSSSVITFDSGIITFDNQPGITTSYSGTIGASNYYGNFSWGKITMPYRAKDNNYNAIVTDGIGGISSSSIVRRYEPLRYTSYIQ